MWYDIIRNRTKSLSNRSTWIHLQRFAKVSQPQSAVNVFCQDSALLSNNPALSVALIFQDPRDTELLHPSKLRLSSLVPFQSWSFVVWFRLSSKRRIWASESLTWPIRSWVRRHAAAAPQGFWKPSQVLLAAHPQKFFPGYQGSANEGTKHRVTKPNISIDYRYYDHCYPIYLSIHPIYQSINLSIQNYHIDKAPFRRESAFSHPPRS